MRANERGVAVVLAMGVVALAAIAAAAMLASQSTWSRHVELTSEHVQAQALVQAGVDWARALLSDDRRVSSVDHLGEPWALRLPPVPVDNGELAGQIDDQQGAFNLNNLVRNGAVSPPHLAQFRRLLQILGLPDVAGSLVDWLDADNEPQPQGGAESDYYQGLQPPYLAANQPLTDVAELALVRGFDEAVRARLRPFVTALPRFTAVNANTASPEVLAAVVEGLGLDGARAMVAQRERAYFRNFSDFFNQLPPGLVVPTENISVSSDYFLASVRVTIGDAQARGTALLARGAAGWPAVVWRKYP
ncbi:MAG TPA: type II secretion system minor pseudopilin GspK [Burkholderiales bacterium]|nr:type II secretion system minor pseudopilin GspK [Burkholderiales bacterium]